MTCQQALDILDQEATEDEEMRAAYSVDVWTRPTSQEANRELTDQASRYRDVLDKAAESDRKVRAKWEESAEDIAILCRDEVSGPVPVFTDELAITRVLVTG